MKSHDLLEMKLADVSDTLLQHKCETGKQVVKVDIPGYDIATGKRMLLTITLRECNGDE